MADANAFLTLLPQFGDVEPSTITAWLETATGTVDSSWEPDEDRAQILLAAHLMSMAGIGPERGARGLAAVKNINSGSLSFTKDDGGMGEYGMTSFGRQFFPIFRANRGGPRVTGTGDYPWPYGGDIVG